LILLLFKCGNGMVVLDVKEGSVLVPM